MEKGIFWCANYDTECAEIDVLLCHGNMTAYHLRNRGAMKHEN